MHTGTDTLEMNWCGHLLDATQSPNVTTVWHASNVPSCLTQAAGGLDKHPVQPTHVVRQELPAWLKPLASEPAKQWTRDAEPG